VSEKPLQSSHQESGSQPGSDEREHGSSRRRLLFVMAPVGFALLAGILAVQLLGGEPKKIPSALIDKPAPEFELPPVQGYDVGLSTADLRSGNVLLVNIFASWCGPCLVEHPVLTRLAETTDIPIYAINYKDAPDNAARWLKRNGDPYTRIGADLSGRVGIDWGVYGVPETFVIDGEGRIRYKHIGVLTEDDVQGTILPLVERLRQ